MAVDPPDHRVAHRERHPGSGALRRWFPVAFLFATFSIGLPGAGRAADDVLDLSQYRGKVVVVDFWASWCVPCRRSIPWLNQMRAKYGDRGLVIIGVNVDKDRRDAERFLQEVPAQFGIVYDSDGKLATHYEVEGMPSSYVFDRNGELAARHLGFQNANRPEYEALLGRLLMPASAADAKTATP
jgi:thiol-disulfide isomerase/thioredoxin